MFLFTEFIGDVEFRYEIGNSLIAYISLVFVVNISIIVAEMFNDIYRKHKRRNWEKKWD